MSFTLITITADYGPRSVGSVSLLASAEMLDSVDLLIKPAVTYSAALKAGRLSLVVPANDDATTAPTGVTYLVTEDIQGAPSNTYRVLVPSAAVGGTIDLSQLAPIVTQPSLVYPNRQGATGATGPGFTAITVTANYGPRAVGSVSLVASAEMLNDVTQEIKPTLPYVGTLKAGRLSLVVPANDDLYTVPTGVIYTVTESIQGAKQTSYKVQIPSGAAGQTIDLSELSPVNPQPPIVFPGPQGATGTDGILGGPGATGATGSGSRPVARSVLRWPIRPTLTASSWSPIT